MVGLSNIYLPELSSWLRYGRTVQQQLGTLQAKQA